MLLGRKKKRENTQSEELENPNVSISKLQS